MPLGIDVSKIEYEIGDITDIDSVERAVQGVDAIVHDRERHHPGRQ